MLARPDSSSVAPSSVAPAPPLPESSHPQSPKLPIEFEFTPPCHRIFHNDDVLQMIITQVARSRNLGDIKSCTLVAKAWNRPAFKLLFAALISWGIVSMPYKPKKHFDLCQLLTASPRVNSLVKHLHVGYMMDLEDCVSYCTQGTGWDDDRATAHVLYDPDEAWVSDPLGRERATMELLGLIPGLETLSVNGFKYAVDEVGKPVGARMDGIRAEALDGGNDPFELGGRTDKTSSQVLELFYDNCSEQFLYSLFLHWRFVDTVFIKRPGTDAEDLYERTNTDGTTSRFKSFPESGTEFIFDLRVFPYLGYFE